jgi:methyl-accepting chemotaxis protein
MATAVPIQDVGRLLGAVRITRSVQQVNDNIRNITIGLGAIGLAALAAGLLLAFRLAGSLSRPLTRLAAAAKRLGHGDLSARAGDVSGPARSKSSGGRSTRWPTGSSVRSRRSASSSPTPRTSSERP